MQEQARILFLSIAAAVMSGCEERTAATAESALCGGRASAVSSGIRPGSGQAGLEMFILNESGVATVTRRPQAPGEPWQQTQLQLSPKLVAEVMSDFNSEKLRDLKDNYQGRLGDGSQWAFLLVQGSYRKAMYSITNSRTR